MKCLACGFVTFRDYKAQALLEITVMNILPAQSMPTMGLQGLAHRSQCGAISNR
jgi:hypothetical protein